MSKLDNFIIPCVANNDTLKIFFGISHVYIVKIYFLVDGGGNSLILKYIGKFKHWSVL